MFTESKIKSDKLDQFPLVSIVIPTYNCSLYLEEAIESVLQQDYPKIELIVLNDGSTDKTEAILQKYTGRLHWETHSNIGQAMTLNRGWQMSKGEMLGYLSADDALLPNAVSTSVNYLSEHQDIAVTYCDYRLIDTNSRVVRQIRAPEFDYRDLVVKFVCQPGPGAFFRRHLFEYAGGWDGHFKQIPDYDFWIRAGLYGDFLRIPRVLASFRIHEESQSFARSDEFKAEESIRVMNKYYALPNLSTDIIAAKNEAMSNATIAAARLHARAGRYRKFLVKLWNALCLYPKNLIKGHVLRMILGGLFGRVRYKIKGLF